MDDTGRMPVIAGLAVGIAFLVVLSVKFAGSSSTLTNEENQINLIVEGMKSTYKPGEKIVFSVNAKGISDNACNIGSPSVFMSDDSSGKTIYWPHSFGFNTAMKCAESAPVNKEWKFGHEAESEIVLDKPGSYNLVASLEDMTVEKKFVVTS